MLCRGADVVLTAGGIQSNHVRQTAAAAARVGIECCVVLEEPAAAMAPEFFASGNLLLGRFFRAQVKRVPAGTDTHAALAEWAAELEMAGARPYIIPVGGSNAIGALGYVICAQELVEQVRDWPTLPAAIVVATASAGTQAGLVAGLFLEQVSIPVVGMCVSRSSDEQDAKVEALANEVLEFLGYTGAIPPPLIMTHDAEVGPGYGQPTPHMIEAVQVAAAREGLLLDPVYTGKAFAGLIGLCRNDQFRPSERVIFLHTGGTPALFAYPNIAPEERR